jgi:predicted negative regulator of RcsB-dependent stress response
MEPYLTEEERVEALQRWWKANNQSVFTGVLAGLAVIAGWNMWQGNKQATAEQASITFQQMAKATEAKQVDTAAKQAERIVEQYGSTAYAEYARLFLAKFKAEAGDFAGAKKLLEEELAKSSDESLKTLARLRLGRVMLAAGEIEPALKLLESQASDKLGKFAGLYEELRGDLFVAAKRPGDARKAYERAKSLGEANPILDLKLHDLPAAS